MYDIIKYINTKNLSKFYFILVMIIFFSIIYTFFDNQDFAGWVDITQTGEGYVIRESNKAKIFLKYAKKYKNFMTKDEFLSIPIIKTKTDIHILDKPNKTSQHPYNTEIKLVLYDIFSQNNRLFFNEFAKLPFKYDKPIEKINEWGIFELSQDYAVTDYFDRLYYSATIQSTLGFGDIFPANRMLRFVTMLQALSTILTIVI